MCACLCKLLALVVLISVLLLDEVVCNGAETSSVGNTSHRIGNGFGHKVNRRTRVFHKHGENLESNERKRWMKRENITSEKDSDLLTRQAEDIFMDEIKGSDQAANRAEISLDLPKETDFMHSNAKAGDITDLETDNMINLNERKGAYLPISMLNADMKDGGKTQLTEQFRNITGFPEFMLSKPAKKEKDVSLVESVADSLQPKTNALSGLSQLLEENKVEQSLKKHLDNFPSNIADNIAHTAPGPLVSNEPSAVDTFQPTSNVNSITFPTDTSNNQGSYVTPVSLDQIYDESISPPERLLDDLSAGKFKNPLSDTVLDKMSNWNANKEFLSDNGYANSNADALLPKVTRISSDPTPVHDFYLKQKPIPQPTAVMSKEALEFFRKDPEVLGRNQEILNGNQFHSLSDLDSIGPPVYPGKVVHMSHKPKHVYLPSKHVFTHVTLPHVIVQDVDEEAESHHRNYHTDDAIGDDGEISEHLYHPRLPVYTARCSSKPCLNGGKCTALVDRYVCTCRVGFMGVNCQKRSYCYPTPCRHGACSENTDGFVCTCENGWEGKRCDERDKCHPSPCMHGGTCTSTYSGIMCSCLLGFKGRYCESEAKCSPLNPCLNGGRCQEMPFVYVCICKNGFVGRNCETILRPTLDPPTVGMKPVPPQAIPIPHNQPPFLLEELNSLNDGPLEEHPVPETSFEASNVDDHHHSHEEHHLLVDSHHFPDIFDEHYEEIVHHDHDHEHGPKLAISNNPAVIIHTGDRTKDKKKENKKDDKKKKNPPKDYKQDDRFVTHLVAAAPFKDKPVDESNEKKKEEDKKPPLEKPNDKSKLKSANSQTLMRLQQQNPQNLHLDDDRVYTELPAGHLGLGGMDHGNAHSYAGKGLTTHPVLYMKPVLKHEVLKKVNAKPSNVAKQTVKQVQKPRVVWAKPSPHQKQTLFKMVKLKETPPQKKIESANKMLQEYKQPFEKIPKIICPGFCKQFCDQWCTNIGCCRKVEIKGPTGAKNPVPTKLRFAENKGNDFVPNIDYLL